jgi:hypothetical protein
LLACGYIAKERFGYSHRINPKKIVCTPKNLG